MKTVTQLILIVFYFIFYDSCSQQQKTSENKILEASGTLPALPKIDIKDHRRFLNDLMLSPYWKVEKGHNGSIRAIARSIDFDSRDDTGRCFIFELMKKKNITLPEGYRIRNKYLNGEDSYTSFKIRVVFGKDNLNGSLLASSGGKVTIPIYESYGKDIGSNSWSEIAIKLSSKDEIYLTFYEQGKDRDRATTFKKVLPAMEEISNLVKSNESYFVKERYAKFFKLFFGANLKKEEIRRFPGIQGRDTFYGYLQAKKDTNYAGVNIKISHPVYCPYEGTRKESRLQKAEYLGTPNLPGDILFFLIEDNAVYLSGEYDQRFGVFSGTESFEGTIEVVNINNKLLLKTSGQFKGWQM